MIRNIHQIWIQGEDHLKDTFPKLYSFTRMWSHLHPDFEYKLWSEADFLPLLTEFQLECYQAAPSFATKADIARYVILNQFGGLYVDTDIEPFVSCEFLLQGENIDFIIVKQNLSQSKMHLSQCAYNNAWIYCKPYCFFVEHILSSLTKFDEKKQTPFQYAMNSVGPGAINRLDKEHPFRSHDTVRILPHDLVEITDFSRLHIVHMETEDIKKLFPFAVSVHRVDQSWIQNKDIKFTAGLVYAWINDNNDFVEIGLVSLLIFLLLVIVCIVFMHR